MCDDVCAWSVFSEGHYIKLVHVFYILTWDVLFLGAATILQVLSVSKVNRLSVSRRTHRHPVSSEVIY